MKLVTYRAHGTIQVQTLQTHRSLTGTGTCLWRATGERLWHIGNGEGMIIVTFALGVRGGISGLIPMPVLLGDRLGFTTIRRC